jgi:hypothetical protein
MLERHRDVSYAAARAIITGSRTYSIFASTVMR